MGKTTVYIFPEESRTLLGLAIQLHNELGCGFKEKVYQDAYEILLKENNIPYEREKHEFIEYHGIVLKHDFYYDFLCYDKIVVEIKAFPEITNEFKAQIINYLHVGKYPLGLLLNFGSARLQYQFFPLIKKESRNNKE